MAIASQETISLLRHHGSKLWIDATHDITELGCQLVTVSIAINGHGLRVAYFITREKTHEAYCELLIALRNQSGIESVVQHVVLDWEAALNSAVLATWPCVDIHFCYFHYCQAIRKWFLEHRGHSHVRFTCHTAAPPHSSFIKPK